jgi:hypothetical protein
MSERETRIRKAALLGHRLRGTGGGRLSAPDLRRQHGKDRTKMPTPANPQAHVANLSGGFEPRSRRYGSWSSHAGERGRHGGLRHAQRVGWETQATGKWAGPRRNGLGGRSRTLRPANDDFRPPEGPSKSGTTRSLRVGGELQSRTLFLALRSHICKKDRVEMNTILSTCRILLRRVLEPVTFLLTILRWRVPWGSPSNCIFHVVVEK